MSVFGNNPFRDHLKESQSTEHDKNANGIDDKHEGDIKKRKDPVVNKENHMKKGDIVKDKDGKELTVNKSIDKDSYQVDEECDEGCDCPKCSEVDEAWYGTKKVKRPTVKKKVDKGDPNIKPITGNPLRDKYIRKGLIKK